MIICSRDEAARLISIESNLLREDPRNLDYKITEMVRGRTEGSNNRTEEEREEIAVSAVVSGTLETAREYGINKDTVSAYKNGHRTTGIGREKVDTSLTKKVNETKELISGAAQNKLQIAIDALTDQKIGTAKARDIAGIAKDMSVIVKNMLTDSPLVDNRQVHIYQPRLREEDDFEVIEVSE